MPDEQNPITEQNTQLIVIYDPLKEFLAHYANAKSVKTESTSYLDMTVEERLKKRIIDGDKIGLEDDLREALKSMPALDIINIHLLDGMKVVGELFGSGEMQLPFVLQSAETMKTAVRFLEPYMEKLEGEQSKGVMVLATVKGDVHDIGKNLVDIILTNNGYRVVNLGIKIGLEAMLDAVVREKADAIGMSGLLVKSTAIMKENLEVMKSRDIAIPVVLGGAALTRKFVEKDLRALYGGPLSYAQDAFDGLHFMERLKNPAAAQAEPEEAKLPTLTEALTAMKQQRERTMEILEGIEQQEYLIPDSFGEWSLRDVVAHMIGWERLSIDRVAILKSGKEPKAIQSEEVDAINETFVRAIDTTDKNKLLKLFQDVRADHVAALQSLTKDEFERDGEILPSVQKRIPHFSYGHEAEHMEKVTLWLEEKEQELDNATGADSKLVMSTRALPWMLPKSMQTSSLAKNLESEELQTEIADYPIAVRTVEMAPGVEKLERTSATAHDNPVPTPPFWGSSVEDNINLEKVWEYLNEIALFRGQWQMRRGKRTPAEYEKEIETIARPKLNELKLRMKRDRVLVPKVTYGYFPCWSEGDDVVVLRPKGMSEEAMLQKWSGTDLNVSDLVECERFTFPRQTTARRLCIADFFRSREDVLASGKPDVISFTAVTVGRQASEYTKKLFDADQYADYLFIHGLSVETAEALAEYWHKIVRAELGIGALDAPEVTRLFSQGYQGSRFSFGYPACPNLEDQTKLFKLIRPDRIDVTLTEEFHIEPEQSTTAVICHHPAAKYFSIK